MLKRDSRKPVPAAARAFSALQAEDAMLPGGVSLGRRSGAIALAALVLAAFPLYLAANAAGLIGDVPAALAKGSNSGPGGGGEDDDSSGPGGSGDDDEGGEGTGTHTRTGARGATDDTSRNGHSTRGTTDDNDTNTRLGTDQTSRNGADTRGTTNDNDTRTGTGNNNTQTQTRTGS